MLVKRGKKAHTLVRLVTELIAGEANDSKTVAILLRQVVHGGEVGDGCASQGRDVLDENDLALVVVERLLLAVDVDDVEGPERRIRPLGDVFWCARRILRASRT